MSTTMHAASLACLHTGHACVAGSHLSLPLAPCVQKLPRVDVGSLEEVRQGVLL